MTAWRCVNAAMSLAGAHRVPGRAFGFFSIRKPAATDLVAWIPRAI
jgi:hypothetical protein